MVDGGRQEGYKGKRKKVKGKSKKGGNRLEARGYRKKRHSVDGGRQEKYKDKDVGGIRRVALI